MKLKVCYHYFVVFRFPCYFGSITGFLNVAACKDCHRFDIKKKTEKRLGENKPGQVNTQRDNSKDIFI